jgi:hypothetical protein
MASPEAGRRWFRDGIDSFLWLYVENAPDPGRSRHVFAILIAAKGCLS